MKAIIAIDEKYYGDYAPSLESMHGQRAFYNEQCEKFLADKGVSYAHYLEDKDYEDYRELDKAGNIDFDYYAPAKTLYKYVHFLKRNAKDYGFTKVTINYSALTKCFGDDEIGTIDTERYYSSTAMLSFTITWEQFRKWVAEADRFEKAKIENGHVTHNAVHEIRVHSSSDWLNIYIN
jgi:hypothetical protein